MTDATAERIAAALDSIANALEEQNRILAALVPPQTPKEQQS